MPKAYYYLFFLLLSSKSSISIQHKNMKSIHRNRQVTATYLFNFFGKPKETNTESTKPVTAGKTADDKKVQELKSKLEKISNKQGRDWKAEAASVPVPITVIKDKQTTSYNFKKPNEFPNLYEGWIRASGDQIAKQMISSVKSAISNNDNKLIEVLFDPVPNLDEVAFGTAMNKKFRLEVSSQLKVPGLL
jgi:hypothetical protein